MLKLRPLSVDKRNMHYDKILFSMRTNECSTILNDSIMLAKSLHYVQAAFISFCDKQRKTHDATKLPIRYYAYSVSIHTTASEAAHTR
jgi:hypothetical protein